MSKEQSINEKLFNLQQEIGTISKDASNPFYKSKYFDINSLIKQLQPLLKKNRLLLMQPIEEDMVMTKIMCLDNETGVVSGLRLPQLTDPQKIGSTITYYRRYTLASLLALESVDDDANIASGKVTEVELPWLNANTPQFNKVKKALQEGTAELADVRKKFKVSKKVEALLQ